MNQQLAPKTPQAPGAGWRGRKVKRFRLIDELGEGAMGRVFVAEDETLKRNVALKLLPAKHRDGRPNHRTERLIKEARAAATLEHPHVVTIYEIDQTLGVHYIAMELVEGGNLERLVQMSGPMEVERACQLVAEAAEALGHAHSRGIIHRDIKPANLLLTRSGRCKLADFGLAAIDAPDDPSRMKCVGTPNFIAPEVARGKGATAQSDIYSLGCSLWFLLTGRPPFTGTSTRDVLKLHVSQPLPDLRKWRGDVPDRLVQTIEKACAKSPADRFDEAEKFAKILRTFTISTGSGGGSGGLPPVVATPNLSGYVMMSGSRQMQPVNALSNVPVGGISGHGVPMLPDETGGKRRWNIPPPAMWAGGGVLVTAAMIALGVWLAKPGPKEASAAGPAPAPPPATVTPPAVVEKTPPPVVTPAAAPTPSPSDASSGVNLIANGTMEKSDSTDGLASWFIHDRFKSQVQILSENGNRFVRLYNDDPTKTVFVDQKIPVDPTWRVITLSARMRATNFKTGGGTSQDGRVAVAFRDIQEKHVGNWPAVPRVTGDGPWMTRTTTVDVPAGAKSLYVQLAIFNATGMVDFDDVVATAASGEGVGSVDSVAKAQAGGGAAPVSASPLTPVTPAPASAGTTTQPTASAVAPSAPAAPPRPPGAAAIEPAPAPTAPVTLSDVVENGSMEQSRKGGVADSLAGWFIDDKFKPYVKVVSENGNRFLRLSSDEPTRQVLVEQRVKLDPSWKSLIVGVRLRASNLKTGEAMSDDGRVSILFRNEAGQRIGVYPPVPHVRRDTTAWLSKTVTIEIPAGARTMVIQPRLMNATGSVDFDDIKVVPQR